MALTRTPTPRGLAAAVQAGPSGFGPDFDEQFAAAVFADPALILGETGCGKEVVARALHAAGFSRTGPFVAVNCATLDKGLAPAALFGHVKGAFTGAVAPAAGLVAQAEGGTLFLDEIGELDRYVQAMLLRLLENRTVRAVGGARERQIRVRVLAATHTDLDAAIRVGEFRADLYHRLAAEVVQLTPLRDRISQLPVLCELLMPGIDAELAGKLPDYSPAGGGYMLGNTSAPRRPRLARQRPRVATRSTSRAQACARRRNPGGAHAIPGDWRPRRTACGELPSARSRASQSAPRTAATWRS